MFLVYMCLICLLVKCGDFNCEIEFLLSDVEIVCC